MISTLEIKRQMKTVFTVGSENPQETILMIGSCRSVAWLNYLNRYNEANGQPFRIHFIDPHDYHWRWNDDGSESVVDFEAAIQSCETDARVLEVLQSTTIFMHEHYAYYGMFNTTKGSLKNIYQFGLAPKLDICFPNFHDRFVLFRDQLTFNAHLREAAEAVGYEILPGTFLEMQAAGLRALDKFYEVCRLGSFPEMEHYFREQWTKQRMFWSGNHTARAFTLFIFKQLSERFLHLNLTPEFWLEASKEDLLSSPFTAMTEFDVQAYGLEWNEPTQPLKQ